MLTVKNCLLLPLGKYTAKRLTKDVRQTLFSGWIMSKDMKASSIEFLAGLVVVFNGEFGVVLLNLKSSCYVVNFHFLLLFDLNPPVTIGSFSNDDGAGKKNVT